jgi:hypothetical protein
MSGVEVARNKGIGINVVMPVTTIRTPFNEILRMSYNPRYKSEEPQKFGGTYSLHE